MKKVEIVFRAISCKYLDGKRSFTQLGMASELGISLSLVNRAVTSLSEINAVKVSQRSFQVIAIDRLLLYWASHRNLKRDIVYQTRAEMSVREIEKNMPDDIAFSGYTAYRKQFDDTPADYSEVYLYATGEALTEIKRRFKASERVPNIVVLKSDDEMDRAIRERQFKHSSVPPPQLFVDLWNMNEWYAKEYADALAKRLNI